VHFALGGGHTQYDREVASQEWECGSTTVWVMLVRLSFQVSLFLKIKLWTRKQFEKRGLHFNLTFWEVFVLLFDFILERSRDSSVGIATGCGLDGPGIEYWWGVGFSAPAQIGFEAHPTSYTMGTGSFLSIKRPGRGDHLPPPSAEVKERVELYLYSPSGPLWPVVGWIVPYLYLLF